MESVGHPKALCAPSAGSVEGDCQGDEGEEAYSHAGQRLSRLRFRLSAASYSHSRHLLKQVLWLGSLALLEATLTTTHGPSAIFSQRGLRCSCASPSPRTWGSMVWQITQGVPKDCISNSLVIVVDVSVVSACCLTRIRAIPQS
eukprot:1294133-Amphidinium_carterae.3